MNPTLVAVAGAVALLSGTNTPAQIGNGAAFRGMAHLEVSLGDQTFKMHC